MSNFLNGPRRLLHVDFDSDGPRIGDVPLLRKTILGFVPREGGEIERLCREICGCVIHATDFEGRLPYIAAALNAGDLTRAAIATGQLSVAATSADADDTAILKAGVDDPTHPGYPAKEPGRKGGQFRPKDALNETGGAEDKRNRPSTKRRVARMALKRVLSTKRLMRLLAENAATVLAEPIPGLDALTTAITIADDLAALKELADGLADAQSAIEFAEKGPVELDALCVSPDDKGFQSFNAFKKIEFEKQLGPAGDGLHYHHLIEQGPNAGVITETDLHSTDNIVRLPRLLREEVTAYYATPQFFEEGLMTPRTFLRGKSVELQKDYGVDVLRQLGGVK